MALTAQRSPAATPSNRLPLSSLCPSDRQLQPSCFCSALTKHWTMCCFGILQAWMFIIKQSVCVLTLAAARCVVYIFVLFCFLFKNFALKYCQPPPSPRQVELYNVLHLHQFPLDCVFCLILFLNHLSHCLFFIFHPSFYLQPKSIPVPLLLFPSHATGALHLWWK